MNLQGEHFQYQQLNRIVLYNNYRHCMRNFKNKVEVHKLMKLSEIVHITCKLVVNQSS